MDLTAKARERVDEFVARNVYVSGIVSQAYGNADAYDQYYSKYSENFTPTPPISKLMEIARGNPIGNVVICKLTVKLYS